MSSVFTGNEVSLPECFDCAEGNVSKIPDGSWDKCDQRHSKIVLDAISEASDNGLSSTL